MKIKGSGGFTLIEIILAVVVSAIAMAAILPFLDRVFLMSHEPRTQLREGMALQGAMEELISWHTNGLDILRARVGGEGGAYLGRYNIVHNRYIAIDQYDTETSAVTSNNLLKITLQNSLGERVTRLFTVPL